MDVSERFGENLLRVRQARKLSQENVADRGAIHRTQISLFESGQRLPRLDTLVKLAGALEVPVPTLLEGISWRSAVDGAGRFEVTDPPELPRLGS
ncbi:MAG TPA: helix-turn-helix transcriptional regulator [Solirubrobacterales bacterium]|nr:helix-turn-helix transcriptional regulator [Solirubrobacterales bacterium]